MSAIEVNAVLMLFTAKMKNSTTGKSLNSVSLLKLVKLIQLS